MRDCAASEMGEDKIRYLVFVNGRFRWRPTRTMRRAGFRMLNLSKGYVVEGKCYPTAEDRARALNLNEEWDRRRRGLPPAAGGGGHRYPHGSVGDGYQRAMHMREQERKAKGVVWTKEQSSRDDWPRAWRWIEALFGDCGPKSVTPEQLLDLRSAVSAKVSETEAHRTVKVWRALWQKMAVFGYCDAARDPSFVFANSAPEPRQAVWSEGEAVRLVKQAWRSGYHGLAALLAVAWDSQLSPIDARRLQAGQRRRDAVGTYFKVGRAKTGRSALATLSKRAERVLGAYLAELAAEPVGVAPIVRNRSGRPYSKDTLGDDFRDIRALVFGLDEKRHLQDFRRSGTVEALAGKVAPSELSSKMANSIGTSNRLHKTYGPVQLASVRDADAARKVGRTKLREQKGVESVTAPVQKYHTGPTNRAKSLK